MKNVLISSAFLYSSIDFNGISWPLWDEPRKIRLNSGKVTQNAARRPPLAVGLLNPHDFCQCHLYMA